jgi:hypothetical protein
MNNNKELDQLVESFLSPAPVKESMGLKELFALFEEVERLNEIQIGGILPTTPAGQKQYEKEPQAITDFYEILQKVLGDVISVSSAERAENKIIKLIEYVTQLKTKRISGEEFSKSFATILFVTSLHKMIENMFPDTPSVAGFSYEKFVSFVLSGDTSISNKEDRHPIFDVHLPSTNEYLSLKLKARLEIEGSISNLYKFFTDTQPYTIINLNSNNEIIDNDGKVLSSSKKITYIVSIKQPNKVLYYSYTFGLKEFINMLGKDKIDDYNYQIERPQITTRHKEEFDKVTREITSLEGATPKDREAINTKKELRNDIVAQMNRVSKEGALQFRFGSVILNSTEGIEKILKGNVLSISTEDKDTIVENNQNIFNKNIKNIIEQSNLVYYKVNNFLLTQGAETEAKDAYSSVKILETSLLTYLPKRKENIKPS